MSGNSEILEQIEYLLNSLGAELTVQKIVLQTFVAHMVSSTPSLSEEILNQLHQDVMGVLERQPIDPSDDPEGQRNTKKLSIEHGERFFRELSTALAATRTKGGTSGYN